MGTDTREQIYAFIVMSMQANGMPPTLREIGDALGRASTSSIDDHVKALEKQGRISRLPGLARGITLSHPSDVGIPVRGVIAAGAPIDIFPDAPETVLVDQALRAANVFALTVRGTSMIEDHICDGDYVVIQPQSACENGDIVVAVHLNQGGGSATSTPVVVNGLVYVGTNFGLYTFDASSGKRKWTDQEMGILHSMPTIVNGVLYIGSIDNNLYALNALTGQRLWHFQTGGAILSSPLVVNNVVYVGSKDGKMYAIQPPAAH